MSNSTKAVAWVAGGIFILILLFTKLSHKHRNDDVEPGSAEKFGEKSVA